MIKLPVEKREAASLLLLIVVSLLIRITLFPMPGAQGDLYYFGQWFNAAADHGPRVFYNVVTSYNVLFCDYPPFNVYLFWIFGSLAKALSLFGTPSINYIIKLLPTLFDAATVLLIFMFVRKRFNFKTSITTAALYAFNPAVIFNSAVWGQFDAIYTFFLLLSLILLFNSKPKLSAAVFAIGLLTKPQGIALAPLIIFIILRNYGWRTLVTSLVTATATVFAVILPFEWSNPVTFLWNIYFGAYSGYGVTTANAFNLWAIGGLWRTDTQVTLAAGWIMFGAATALILYILHKRLDPSDEFTVLFAAFMLFFSFFMLPTRIHERYLFPALSTLALMLPFSKKMRPFYGVLTFTCLANMAFVLQSFYTAQAIPLMIVETITIINLSAYLFALVRMLMDLQGAKCEARLPRSALEQTSNGEIKT
ncbi:MAG: glycosyltransferase family 39 protein [Candidatus Bathyarchaeota archaeon]|nr:glycosyltransferase family 39 protein [Candidatus Bathyarchaeota archaeon]